MTHVGFIVCAQGSQRGLSVSPAPFMLDAQGYAAPTHPDLQVRFVAMRECFAQRQSMSPWFLFPRALRVSVSDSARELSGPRVGPAGRGTEKGVRPGLGHGEALAVPARLWKRGCIWSDVGLPEMHLLVVQKWEQMGLFCPQLGNTFK